MLYLEYDRLRKQCRAIEADYAALLAEKAALFARTQPGAVDPGKQPGGAGGQDNAFERYLIVKDSRQLDQRISEARTMAEDWARLLDLHRAELRRSRDLLDRIYVGRYLDRLPMDRIAGRCGITRGYAYKLLKKIEIILSQETK